jgi:hypothetical protein
MPLRLIPPELWQGLPFGHPEGLMDFLGTHNDWHRALALAVAPSVPDRRFDDLVTNLDPHNVHHAELAKAMSLSPSDDFSRYDLTQRQGWVLFMQIHALEHVRLRQQQIALGG